MESFQPIHNPNKPVGLGDSRTEFFSEITQLISYLQSHQAADLVLFIERDLKYVRRSGLSEKNLKYLDDLSKYRSSFGPEPPDKSATSKPTSPKTTSATTSSPTSP